MFNENIYFQIMSFQTGKGRQHVANCVLQSQFALCPHYLVVNNRLLHNISIMSDVVLLRTTNPLLPPFPSDPKLNNSMFMTL